MRNTVLGTAVALMAGGAAAEHVQTSLPAAGGLAIDFRDQIWSAADGQKLFTFNGLTIDTQWSDSVLAWDADFGLGVRSTFDPGFMATFRESIRIRGAYGVTGLWLHRFGDADSAEIARVNGNLSMFNGLGEIDVWSNEDTYGFSDDEGNYYANIGPIEGGHGLLKVRPASSTTSQYSVLGLTTIPLPSAGLMGAAGVFGVAVRRRR